jgi:CheY-like chemotaxis protein
MVGAAVPRPPAIILVVDDDPADRELTRRAFQGVAGNVELRTVTDGVEAIEYLFRRGRFESPESSPRPDLILLDLNMPRLNGQQVLARLRENQETEGIPIVVMTTSSEPEEVLRSYNLGCNSFIQKPVEIASFIEALNQLRHYWFELVSRPAVDHG